MRQISMQKTVQNASNLYAKNSAKCVKFICNKQCKMRQTYMQNNSAKCVKLVCKKLCEMRKISMQKQCKMRRIYMQKTVQNA